MRAEEDETYAPVRAVVLLLLIFLAAWISVATRPADALVSSYWPAAGLSVVLLIFSPRRWWPWLVVAMFLATGAGNALGGRLHLMSAAYALTNTVEALAAAWLLCRGRSSRPVLRNQGDLLRLFLAVLIPCLPAAMVAGLLASLTNDHELPSTTYALAVRTAAWSHAAWMLTLTAAALSWTQPTTRRRPNAEFAIQTALLFGTLIAMYTPIAAWVPAFLTLPLLIWSAFRFGLRTVSLQVVITGIAMSVATRLGDGPFAMFTQALLKDYVSASATQAFIAVATLMVVPLAISLEQSDRLKSRLAGSSALFRHNFSESLLSMLVLLDGRNGLEVYDANRTAAELLGYSVDELIGLRLADVVRTDSPLPDGASLDSVTSWRDLATLPNRPGSRLTISLMRLAQSDQGMYTAQLLDVTAEHEATAGLKAQQQLTDITLDTTPCIILVADLRGTVIRANRAAVRLTGLTERQIRGRPVWDTITDDESRAGVKAMFIDPGGAGLVLASESGVRTHGGKSLRVLWNNQLVRNEHGEATYAVLTGIDVTAERNASALMRNLLSATITTALIGTDLKGRVTVFNAGAEGLTGHDRVAAIGMEFVELLDPADLREWADQHHTTPGFDSLTKQLEADSDAAHDRLWQRADGSIVRVSMSLSAVTDQHGRQLGWLCVARDVTELRRGQQLLVDALEKERLVVEQLRDLDAAKDEFVSTVSHELRTPVSSIVGYTEMLTTGEFGEVSAVQRHALEAVGRNGERLITLANNLLTLNGLATGSLDWERTPVDLVQVLGRARDTISPRLSARRLTVNFHSEPGEVQVLGDAPHLERALDNLLSNAVKFTEDGGSITCRLDINGDNARLVVSDTGLGIPKEEQHALFDKFFRSSTSQARQIQGTGLGLAVVKATVSAHGGTVAIQSEHLQGTTVTISLPLASASQQRARQLV